jgi:hypothetical protein
MDVLALNISYTFMLVGICTSDILWLRLLLCGAQGGFLVFGFLAPNRTIVMWNAVFLVFNVIQVLKILRERRPVHVPEPLRRIHRETFTYLSEAGFLKLWNMGQTVRPPLGWVLHEGSCPVVLMLIEHGEIEVFQGGQQLGSLQPGDFLGEMEFITGELLKVGFKSSHPGLVLRSWTRQDMINIEKQDPALCIRLQGVLGRGALRKLQDANLRAV